MQDHEDARTPAVRLRKRTRVPLVVTELLESPGQRLKPDRASYAPLDFLDWRENQSLAVAPEFQRRSVWQRPAKAYLIDTLLRGLPVPPIYLRVRQSKEKSRLIREVIDGQQRISAVLDYIDGTDRERSLFVDPSAPLAFPLRTTRRLR